MCINTSVMVKNVMLPFSAFLYESDLLIIAATIKLMEHRFGLINFIVKIMKKCDECKGVRCRQILYISRYNNVTILQY